MLKNKTTRSLAIVVTIGCLTAAVGSYFYLSNQIKTELFVHLERDARITLAAINPDRVELISQTYSDSDENFSRLRTQMLALQKQFAADGVDSIYVMKKNGNRIEFLVDSTSLNDPEYGPPGDPYPDPPGELYPVFTDGRPSFVGPYTDVYGEFYSYFIPIKKASDSNIVGVLGVDVTTEYHRNFLKNSLMLWLAIILLIYVLCLIILTFTARLIHSQKKLDNEEGLAEELVNVLPDIFYLLNNDNKFSLWNKAFSGKLGIDKERISQIAFPDLFDAANKIKITDSLKNALKNDHNIVEAEIKNKDGQPVLYEFYHAVLKNESGEIVGIAGSGHDITLRHEREMRLAKQRMDMENINHLMVGRETMMLELKKEISSLRAEREGSQK